MTLDETIEKLTRISATPCFCDSCERIKRVATEALKQVSPSVNEMMKLAFEKPKSDELRRAEEKFRVDELHRLKPLLETVLRGRCSLGATHVRNAPKPQEVKPELPAQQIPDLPTPTEEQKRQFAAYAAAVRKRRINYLKNPRVPGSYTIK